jgi:hypothetical protein
VSVLAAPTSSNGVDLVPDGFMSLANLVVASV